MNLFLDTEFTSLRAPRLISLALVAENGERIYVELDDWEEGDCTEFVRKVVVPLLDGPRMSRVQAGRDVAAFIERYQFPTVWTDAPEYDATLLRDLVGGGVWYDIKPLGATMQRSAGVWDVIDMEQYGAIMEAEFAKGELRRHHALDDARANLIAWRTARRITKHEALSPISSVFKSPPV